MYLFVMKLLLPLLIQVLDFFLETYTKKSGWTVCCGSWEFLLEHPLNTRVPAEIDESCLSVMDHCRCHL